MAMALMTYVCVVKLVVNMTTLRVDLFKDYRILIGNVASRVAPTDAFEFVLPVRY